MVRLFELVIKTELIQYPPEKSGKEYAVPDTVTEIRDESFPGSEDLESVTMPDGDDFIAYQRMSTTGNLYVDEKENWEYFEQGTGCLVAHKAPDGKGFLIRYQGTLCASVRNPLEEKRQSIRSAPSTPQGFGRESSGPRTVE